MIELMRADYGSFLREIGMTEDAVRSAVEDLSDHIDMPPEFDNFELRQSKIQGQGLFAKTDILKDDLIAPARIGNKRTIAGRRTNHSPTPNCRFVPTEDGAAIMVANDDIRADEELTVDYRHAMRVSAALDSGLSAKTIREQVEVLQKYLLQLPENLQVRCETKSYLSGGVYAREVFIPEGSLVIGAVHSKDHVNVMCGDITVLTEEGAKRFTGYHVVPTKAGMKRAGLTHGPTYWTTLLHTDKHDLSAIEDEMTVESDMLQTRRLPDLLEAHSLLGV